MSTAQSRTTSDISELARAPWREQLRELITDPAELTELMSLSDPELRSIKRAAEQFPMAITPYYASLMDPEDRRCPIRMQAVPSAHELSVDAADIEDPLAEDEDSPIPGVTHRYPDRVLVLVTHQCSMFCRHCTRKRRVGDPDQRTSRSMLDDAIRYIESDENVRDVLLSGGDPFLLSDERLDELLGRLLAIDHVEVVRIGTRTPVVLPQRITPQLVEVLRRHVPIWVNTHFNHPRELTDESRRALAMMADAGIPLGNQSVLLRDVNDCPLILRELFHGLVRNRVRPYYLYQCDLSRGIEHFRTPVAKGIEIMEMLIGHTSGFAVPRYVVDAPGGGGKIPLQPNYMVSMGTRKVVLRNYEGVITLYTEPRERETTCPPDCTYCDERMMRGQRWAPEIGVGKLFNQENETISLVPGDLEREERRETGGEE
ncbi:MAG: lysine 2,3-aminomutase [Polyangia bacterium]